MCGDGFLGKVCVLPSPDAIVNALLFVFRPNENVFPRKRDDNILRHFAVKPKQEQWEWNSESHIATARLLVQQGILSRG